MGNPQTITLNGRQYDALTGKIIDDSVSGKAESTQPKNKPDHARPKPHHMARTIDGFMGGVRKKRVETSKPVTLKPTAEKSPSKQKSHKLAPHIKRTTEKSKTLMRRAVVQPEISPPRLKSKIKSSSHYRERLSDMVASTAEAAQPAKEALTARAQAIQKSDLVTKFGELTTPPKTITADPNLIQTTANSEVHLKNLDALAQQEATKQVNKDVFEEAALKLANSYQVIKHKHTPFYKKIAKKLHMSTKALFITVVIVIVLIIIGTFAYLFKNNLELAIAEQRSGVHTSLPSYTPSGFGLSDINYTTSVGAGSIKLNYKSNSDSRSYSLAEQTATTDSQGIVDLVINPSVGSAYQTVQVGGRTVYFFGQSAIWVDGGIYYRLTNHASLTTDQLTQIISGI